jgi:hypothetical protein
MTESDLQQIEKHVRFTLPASYRATLLRYPFEAGSFADEFMLPNRPQQVIELSGSDFSSPEIGQPFFIGSDGGEECYFLDASKTNSGVFVFKLETGKHSLFSSTWTAYLDHIRAIHTEIAADEEAERQRKQNKKWWQFWL